MALVACAECGKDVSTGAKACPNCGAAPPKKASTGGTIAVVVIGVLIVYAVTRGGDDAVQAPGARQAVAAPLTPRQAAEKEAVDMLAADAKAGPAWIKSALLSFCEAEDRHLNYIKVIERKAAGGTALYCQHSMYGKYALDVGSRGRNMADWVQVREAALRKHKITRVGVWGTGEYASGTWFEVK